MERWDKYWIGIVLGLLMPAVVAYFYIDTYGLRPSTEIFGLALKQMWS